MESEEKSDMIHRMFEMFGATIAYTIGKRVDEKNRLHVTQGDILELDEKTFFAVMVSHCVFFKYIQDFEDFIFSEMKSYHKSTYRNCKRIYFAVKQNDDVISKSVFMDEFEGKDSVTEEEYCEWLSEGDDTVN